jgi:hypothetical protein
MGKRGRPTKRMMEEMNTKMDGNQAEMRSTVCAIWSELKETIQHEMKAIIQPIQVELDEMTACHKAMEAETERNEPDPGMIQSIEEHQEISKEGAAVILVRGPRKQRRVCNLDADTAKK